MKLVNFSSPFKQLENLSFSYHFRAKWSELICWSLLNNRSEIWRQSQCIEWHYRNQYTYIALSLLVTKTFSSLKVLKEYKNGFFIFWHSMLPTRNNTAIKQMYFFFSLEIFTAIHTISILFKAITNLLKPQSRSLFGWKNFAWCDTLSSSIIFILSREVG